MNEIMQYLKVPFRFLFSTAFIFALLFAVSCDEGEEEEPVQQTLAGTYVFNKATLQTSLSLDLGLPFPVPISAGKDITSELAAGLLEEAPCGDIANGAIELSNSNKLYFTCINEENFTPTQAGVWSENSDLTELNLSLASPPLPSPIQLSLNPLVVNGDLISGTITDFPLTPDLMAGFMTGLVDPSAIPDLIANLETQLVNIDIEFKKVAE